jgi:hypothetical protein
MTNTMFRPREGNEDMVGIWRVVPVFWSYLLLLLFGHFTQREIIAASIERGMAGVKTVVV